MKEYSGKIYEERRPIIIFDGFCNLCSRSVEFVLRKERQDYFYFTSMDSEWVRKTFSFPGEMTANPDSIIFLEGGKLYFHSTAVLRIARKLRFPFWLFYYAVFLPKFLRDPVYRWISQNRYSIFGKSNHCYIPDGDVSHKFL